MASSTINPDKEGRVRCRLPTGCCCCLASSSFPGKDSGCVVNSKCLFNGFQQSNKKKVGHLGSKLGKRRSGKQCGTDHFFALVSRPTDQDKRERSEVRTNQGSQLSQDALTTLRGDLLACLRKGKGKASQPRRSRWAGNRQVSRSAQRPRKERRRRTDNHAERCHELVREGKRPGARAQGKETGAPPLSLISGPRPSPPPPRAHPRTKEGRKLTSPPPPPSSPSFSLSLSLSLSRARLLAFSPPPARSSDSGPRFTSEEGGPSRPERPRPRRKKSSRPRPPRPRPSTSSRRTRAGVSSPPRFPPSSRPSSRALERSTASRRPGSGSEASSPSRTSTAPFPATTASTLSASTTPRARAESSPRTGSGTPRSSTEDTPCSAPLAASRQSSWARSASFPSPPASFGTRPA